MIINPTNREEIRIKAIDTATEILLRDGNLTMRMDDVAQKLSVSKRTLYEIFSSKEALLIECLKNHMGHISQLMEAEMSGEDDVKRITTGSAIWTSIHTLRNCSVNTWRI